VHGLKGQCGFYSVTMLDQVLIKSLIKLNKKSHMKCAFCLFWHDSGAKEKNIRKHRQLKLLYNASK